MDISAALAADLMALTHALDDPDAGLDAGLRALIADLGRAVSSYTGLRMTIAIDGHAVSFGVLDKATAPPATSLLVPLAALTPTDVVGTLLIYAATPGAFVDLAADLGFALGIDLSRLVLDRHLDPLAEYDGTIGLDDHSAINQAIGVLIDRGSTPESARDELHRLAALDHGDLRTAAVALIVDVARGPGSTA